MRFFLALLAVASADPCDMDCVEAIYGAIVAAPDSYQDGDMAVYGYLLYQGYTAAGNDGMAFVGGAVAAMAGEGACNNDGSAAAMTTCLKDADADGLQPVKDWLNAEAQATHKAAYEGIIGAIANQLAPSGLAASTWTGLDDATFNQALKVYYIVGAVANFVIPTVKAAFDSTDQGANCFARTATAIGYAAGGDMVAAIANNGEKAFGADGLGHVDCFGAENTAVVTDLTVTQADGTAQTFTDVAAITTFAEAAEKTAYAEVAKFEVAIGGDEDESTASPAAMVSAAVAFVALML